MRITVFGMGKIGLPLAVQYAHKGHSVVGVDVNPATVELINSGSEPFPGESRLQERLDQVVPSGLLRATLDGPGAVAECDVVVIVVPLFVDDDARPDFLAMDAATTSVGRGLRPGTLVSYETTLPVGTTRGRMVPILERASGLEAGRDFWVVFSPERVLTGRVFDDLRRYPKLIGGIDATSAGRGRHFYEAVLDFDERDDLERPNGVWDLGSAEAAEMAKLVETTYRDVNIGLANQFAIFAEDNGIDLIDVIEACNSQPYSHVHRPGIAVGGHCIPIYPRLYLSNDPDATIVRVSREVNAAMPHRAVARIEEALGDLRGKRVVVLGAAYRGGVKETAFSGVFALAGALESRGAAVSVADPMFSDVELESLGLSPFHRGDEAEVAILQADHEAFLDWNTRDVQGVELVFDGRGKLDPESWIGTRFLRVGASELVTRQVP